MNARIIAIAILVAVAGNAYPAGFRLAEQDAKANGMGNAFVAVADNASAAWYNPAALINLEGTNLSLGSVMVEAFMEHKNDSPGVSIGLDRIKERVHMPPHFYAAHKINADWAVGLSINTPFGLSTEWDPALAATRRVATRSEIKTAYHNLNGVRKINEHLSVAAGASYVKLNAGMDKIVTATHPLGLIAPQTVEQTLKGAGTSTGYNLAALYKMDKWRFGSSYRSKVRVKAKGTMLLPLTGGWYTSGVDDSDAFVNLTLPDLLQIGASYKQSDSWPFSAEADYTNWTTYRLLAINYVTRGGIMSTSLDPKDWESVWAFRAGAEHKLSDAWKVRMGAFYDMTPVKDHGLRDGRFDTRVPDSDRLAASVGAGYAWRNLTVDASLMYIKFMKRTIAASMQDDAVGDVLNGAYEAHSVLPAITAAYKF